ncbi:MAG: ATP-dependent DNA helicase RecQ, partial [Synechococcaceae cyanobacterium RL_1_2]|nr:ATP-dependent DNA helicase RecQ [Synechococcaceae cyanobacterium RL_1_2]
PTGAGKSLCFQLPALMSKGTTIVVSPLIALMENQLGGLRAKNIPAACLHSNLPRAFRLKVLTSLAAQKLKLLYLAPETLLTPSVWNQLLKPELKINGLIIDEAHCLAAWGDTFRPAYHRLGVVRSKLEAAKSGYGIIPIAAFTATAAPQTQQLITQSLGLRTPTKFLVNPYKANIDLKIRSVWTPRGRRNALHHFIAHQGSNSGLVYTRSRRSSEEIAEWLRSLGYTTQAYHGGLNPIGRRAIEQNWLQNQIQFVVCTCAFGMGIDKPDVGWVAHYEAPNLLNEYIQEIGRGGRNGDRVKTLTLVSEPTGLFNGEDRQRQNSLMRQIRQQIGQLTHLISQLPPEGDIYNINRQWKGAELALALLQSSGQVTWQDPFRYRLKPPINQKHLGNQILLREQQLMGQTRNFFKTKSCRWQFILMASGFQRESQGFRCGHCDNCKKK